MPVAPMPDISLASQAAIQYRLRYGWNPLPSHRSEKRPVLAFSRWWDTPIEGAILANWDTYGTPNIQLMCGARWGLAVVDLDGETARDVWSMMGLYHETPRTWSVKTGGGGWHLWYRLPEGLTSFPKRTVWRSEGVRHSAIDVLGDNSLVIAPPSLHVTTRRRYEFSVGPAEMPTPAMMPDWMIHLPAVPTRPIPARVAPIGLSPRLPASMRGVYHTRAVLAAIRDKAALAASWGLRLTGKRRGDWLECHSVVREDEHPSAGFSRVSGYYCEPGAPLHLSLFDLAVGLGQFTDWREACNALGHQYAIRFA